MANCIQQCVYYEWCGNYTDGAGDGVCGECYDKARRLAAKKKENLPSPYDIGAMWKLIRGESK